MGLEQDSFVCLLFLIAWFSPGEITFAMKGVSAGFQSHICWRAREINTTENRNLGGSAVGERLA